MKKIILPGILFGVLSTTAFEETIEAAPINNPVLNITSASLKVTTQYIDVKAGSHLNVRKSPSTSGLIIGKLTRGTKITIYSETNGWAKINYNGKDGFVSTKYLSTTNPSETNTTIKYANVHSGSKLNLRKSASTSASIVSQLPKDTKVSVYSESNGWAKVRANGKDGYVSTLYLTTKNTSSGTSSASQAATTSTKYVNVSPGSNLNLRNKASTSGSIIVKLARGTEVKVLSETNGWSKVSAYGKEGFVSSQYLSKSKPTSTSSKIKPAQTTSSKYVNISTGSSLNLRKSPSTTASILTKLTRGTKVTVYTESNGWAKIKADGKEGYVSTKYLSSSKPSTQTTQTDVKTTKKYVNVAVGSALNMRNKPSSSGSIIIKIARGIEVKVYSESNGWAKINAYGQDGYVSTQYLSSTKPTTSSKDVDLVKKYVNIKTHLNMRSSGSTNASILTKIPRATLVYVVSESKGWSKILYNGKEGYVSSQYLSNSKPSVLKPEPEVEQGSKPNDESNNTKDTVLKYVYVSEGSTLNMRAEASTSASIVTKLVRGTVVTVFSEENGWARITANGLTGYVSSQYLTSEPLVKPGTGTGTIVKSYINYNLTLNEMLNIQMEVRPQTDKKYQSFLREDALILNRDSNPTMGTVQGNNWNIRGGAGTSFWIIGKVNNGDNLQILSSVEGPDGYTWYEVNYNKTWVNASPEDVHYYINPNNFMDNTVESFQFVKLSQTTNLDEAEVNERILFGKGILQGQANSFIHAGALYGINEIYLISHALLETGNGASILARGVEVNGKTVYNMYGIGAFDNNAIAAGAEFAYNAGWFTPEAAIIGGAQFIAERYINRGQDTLYKMRWNPASAENFGYAAHQYATDIGWAAKQVKQIYNLYSLLDSYTITLEIPKYK